MDGPQAAENDACSETIPWGHRESSAYFVMQPICRSRSISLPNPPSSSAYEASLSSDPVGIQRAFIYNYMYICELLRCNVHPRTIHLRAYPYRNMPYLIQL